MEALAFPKSWQLPQAMSLTSSDLNWCNVLAESIEAREYTFKPAMWLSLLIRVIHTSGHFWNNSTRPAQIWIVTYQHIARMGKLELSIQARKVRRSQPADNDRIKMLRLLM
jgi:hypothetical protein